MKTLNDEQSGELGYGVGIVYYIAEKAVKGELGGWIEQVGFDNYIAKLLEAQQTLDKYDLDDEDIAELLKGFHDRGGR